MVRQEAERGGQAIRCVYKRQEDEMEGHFWPKEHSMSRFGVRKVWGWEKPGGGGGWRRDSEAGV